MDKKDYYSQQFHVIDFIKSYVPEEESKAKVSVALLNATDEYIEYVASFETFDELLKSSSCSKLIKLREKIRSVLPENVYSDDSIEEIDDIIVAINTSATVHRREAEKHYETCKELAENHGLEIGTQKLQNSIIDQAEKCSKAFKRYVGFLDDEDYIKFEEIESNIEQFIKMYEELFGLDPESPKKLGCLFRLTKTAYRLIWTMEKNFSGKEILYPGNPLLREYIESIDGEIVKLRQE